MNRTKEGRIIRGEIKDARLKVGMERVRSGTHQLFGPRVIEYGKVVQECDFSIDAPEKSWYAEEVSGVWYWVEGCDKCNGLHEFFAWHRCDKHDVCVDCGVTRGNACVNGNGSVWGHVDGFQCNECFEAKRRRRLAAAEERIRERDEEGEDSFDFEDDAKCPWCGAKCKTDYEDHGADGDSRECDECERHFKLTAEHSVSWSTRREE